MRTRSATNGISAYLTAIRHEDGSYQPALSISFDCFPEGLDEAFALVEEMLFKTAYEPDEIGTLCAAQAPALKSGIGPNTYAQELAEAALDEGIAYNMRGAHDGARRRDGRRAARGVLR